MGTHWQACWLGLVVLPGCLFSYVLCGFFMYLCAAYQLLFLALQQKCLAKAASGGKALFWLPAWECSPLWPGKLSNKVVRLPVTPCSRAGCRDMNAGAQLTSSQLPSRTPAHEVALSCAGCLRTGPCRHMGRWFLADSKPC